MSLLGFASAPAVLQYLKAAADMGISPKQALQDCSIDSALLDNKIKRITGEAFQRLIRYLIDKTNDPCFGLKTARYVQPGSYSVLGFMVMNCKSLRDAMLRTPTYEALVGDMGTTEIITEQGKIQMRWHCQYSDPLVCAHMVDNVLGSWVNFARFLVDRPDGKPRQVWFEHPAPNAEFLPQYEMLFRCPIKFNAPMTCLWLDDTLLDLPMRQSDEQLLKTLESHADILMADISQRQPLPLQTKNVIKGLMLEGLPRKEMVAKRLGLTERTLQRRLQQFETSYQQILDELRQEQASALLSETELPIQEIATRLGFSEPRSFHRSFKSWTNMTPGEYRIARHTDIQSTSGE
jgi:AraC-like DNA-binding protein